MKQNKTVDLSIIIVLYRSEDTIKILLDSIAKSPDKLNKQIIVVDNAFPDKALSIAQSHKLNPEIIRMNSNVGFSRAVNAAIKISTGKHVLLLNADTKIIGNSLERLVNFANSPVPLGAVAPRLISLDGSPQPSVFKFPTIANAIKKNFLNDQTAFGKYLPKAIIQTVDVAQMAALLIPRSTIQKVGLLDEKYFFYYEDIDYAKRLKKANLPIYYLPTAKIEHVHGASGKFVFHLKSPLLASSKIYYGEFYSNLLNLVLWIGHKWQVILRRKKFRD